MRDDTDRQLAVQILAESGEATRMIDALIKANPAKAAEAAEIRLDMQKQRLTALREESPGRFKIVGMEHLDECKAAKKLGEAAFVDLVIKLVEEDKIRNPDRTDFSKYEEEEKEKRLNKVMEDSYFRINADRADLRHSIQSQKDTEGEMLLLCIAVGVAATALGASSLAIVSIGTACVISDYMKELEPARKNMLNNAPELTKDEYNVMVRATAKEHGKADPTIAR